MPPRAPNPAIWTATPEEYDRGVVGKSKIEGFSFVDGAALGLPTSSAFIGVIGCCESARVRPESGATATYSKNMAKRITSTQHMHWDTRAKKGRCKRIRLDPPCGNELLSDEVKSAVGLRACTVREHPRSREHNIYYLLALP